jgi:hypothetical protein
MSRAKKVCSTARDSSKRFLASPRPVSAKTVHKLDAFHVKNNEAPSWRDDLCLGLPNNFDFANIKTADDAFDLIVTLPNRHRGIAARGLYEHRHIVGNRVAFSGFIKAWNHDHTRVNSAFGGNIPAVLRELNPSRKKKASVIAWRGVDDLDAIQGFSWTTDRDVACFFAIRSPRNTPFLLRYEFQPEDILARYNGRSEHELIVDPLQIDLNRVQLDDGSKERSDTYVSDLVSHEDISPDAITNWRTRAKRYAARIKAKERRMLDRGRIIIEMLKHARTENRSSPKTNRANRKPDSKISNV